MATAMAATGTPPSGRLSKRSSQLGLGTEKSISGEGESGVRPFSPQSPALTAVILHDASYKHRFSRPGTRKAELASIVERPERITAAIMGICAAQTRVGGHKMSIHKTRRMGSLEDPEVMLVHGSARGKGKWLSDLMQLCSGVETRHRRGDCEIPADKGWDSGDLFLCPSSREAFEGCIGAVYEAVDRVFTGAERQGVTRRAFVAIRPPGHHCAETTPGGFCWVNNVHIGITHAARTHGLTHAVILDIDLHHGDGSQAIAWHLSDLLTNPPSAKFTPPSPVPKVAYFSLHDINSYPCESGDPGKIRNASVDLDAHGQRILNMHLKKYRTLAEFWEIYETVYSQLLSRAKDWLVRENERWRKDGKVFKAAVFISAGFDASEHEMAAMQRHKIHVPTGFYARFARESVILAEDELTGCSGRVISVLEGGYSNRAITSGVLAHLVGLAYETPERAMFRHHQVHRGSLSEEYFYESDEIGNGYGPGDHGGTPGDYLGGEGEGLAVDYYDPQWWDIEHLVELENKTAKRPKKAPPGAPVNYLSATVASKAKVEPKVHIKQQEKQGVNGPPPPPVLVDWATATVELSKQLIPQEETDEGHGGPPSPTGSVRSVGKKQSAAGHAEEGLTKMVLRERKAKPTVVEERAVSRASVVSERRRKSVAGVITSPASLPASTSGPTTRSGRVPPMQSIPSRGPSPSSQRGGRRVVSMSMTTQPPEPPQRTGSIKNSITSTQSPPPPTLPASRALRRANSTSNMNGASAPVTRSATRPAGKPVTQKKSATPPQSPPQGQDEESQSVEDTLVKGMRKIRITYKAGENYHQQKQPANPDDKDTRVRELEKLAEEKQREIEQLRQEAKERSEKERIEKAIAAAVAGSRKVEKPAISALPPSGSVSAVRMAAMRLEGAGGGKLGKLQTKVSSEVATGTKSPVTPTGNKTPSLGQSPVTVNVPTTVVKGSKPSSKQTNITTVGAHVNGSKPSCPTPQTPKTTSPNQAQLKNTPSPTIATPVDLATPPKIVMIPPSRPTSSWDSDMNAAVAPHAAQGADGMLSVHGYKSYHEGRTEPEEEQGNASGQGEVRQPQEDTEMSPPPPYSSAVRADPVQHQVTRQQSPVAGSGGFGFNMMKPLTVPLGGGSGSSGGGGGASQ